MKPKLQKSTINEKTETAELCQELCQANPDVCDFFAGRAKNGKCLLYYVGYKNQDGFISGPKNC